MKKRLFLLVIFYLILMLLYMTKDVISYSKNSKVIYEGVQTINYFDVNNEDNTDLIQQSNHTEKVLTVFFKNKLPYQNMSKNDIKEYFSTYNNMNIKLLDFHNYSKISISNYTPVVRFLVNDYKSIKEEVENFYNYSFVDDVYYGEYILTKDDFQIENVNINGCGFEFDEPDGGSGIRSPIKVGIIDSGKIDTSLSNFDDVTIVDYNPNDPYGEHATYVSSIIKDTYDDNESLSLYVARLYAQSSEGIISNLDPILNWMADEGVELINMSMGLNNNNPEIDDVTGGTYSSLSRQIDEYISNTNILFYAAVGNGGQKYDYVASPSTGYNVIGVGALTGNQLSTYSLYNDFDSGIYFYPGEKPNIVADGTLYPIRTYGVTSFSTPRITGSVAKLLSLYPNLRGNVALINSLVHTASNDNVSNTNNDYHSSGLHKQIGAGKFSYLSAYIIALNSKYYYFEWGENKSNELIHTSTPILLTEGKEFTATLFTIKNNHSTSINPQNLFTSYSFKLVNISNNQVVAFKKSDINIQFLRYEVPISGYYRLEIWQHSKIKSIDGIDKLAYSYIETN